MEQRIGKLLCLVHTSMSIGAKFKIVKRETGSRYNVHISIWIRAFDTSATTEYKTVFNSFISFLHYTLVTQEPVLTTLSLEPTNYTIIGALPLRSLT